MEPIGFNRPYLTGKELERIADAAARLHLSGNGHYTRYCQAFFEQHYGIHKTLLTSSCTDALEMCALLLDIQPGDEVIIPSFTFVSTANAFALRGARIIMADSMQEHPNLDVKAIEALISPRTKAVVAMHYAGMACDMPALNELARRYGFDVVEDAAQGVDASLQGKALGSWGRLGAFSFHETKNLIAGEGGMLCVNDADLVRRAEIIWEKGTNRAAFYRGEVDKYNWVALGSSFLASELTAAFLSAQLDEKASIQALRFKVWNAYHSRLAPLAAQGRISLLQPMQGAVHNAAMFCMVCPNNKTRNALMEHLRSQGIQAVFHYLPLHKSPYFNNLHDGRSLPNADFYAGNILRLPFFCELSETQIERICNAVYQFFGQWA